MRYWSSQNAVVGGAARAPARAWTAPGRIVTTLPREAGAAGGRAAPRATAPVPVTAAARSAAAAATAGPARRMQSPWGSTGDRGVAPVPAGERTVGGSRLNRR